MSNPVELELNNKSVVAFLDVLGFSSLLKNPEKIQAYFNIALQAVEKVESASEIKAVLISDSIVLWKSEASIQNLRLMCSAVAQIQKDLALENIWIRGGISIGSFESKQYGWAQVVVGEGLVRAYELESKWAKVPRVLIDPIVFKELGKNKSTVIDQLYDSGKILPEPIFDPIKNREDVTFPTGGLVTADGIWVHYGYVLIATVENLEKILTFLQDNLSQRQEHYSKYKWVASYLYGTFGTNQNRSRYSALADSFDHFWEKIRSV